MTGCETQRATVYFYSLGKPEGDVLLDTAPDYALYGNLRECLFLKGA